MNDSTTDKTRTAVKVGAAVTLSTMEEYFQVLISKVIFYTQHMLSLSQLNTIISIKGNLMSNIVFIRNQNGKHEYLSKSLRCSVGLLVNKFVTLQRLEEIL